MENESHISIFVKSMRVNVRIGLLPAEREAPQPLDVTVELFTALDYLDGVDADSIIDYAQIYDAVKSWEARDHVDLLETYLQELLTLGFTFDRVTAMRATIAKPEIFDEAQGAGLSVFMRRGDYRLG